VNKTAGKMHVAKVLHEKTQLATGKKTLVWYYVQSVSFSVLLLFVESFC
jgi:hypothetical protein